MDLGKVNHLIKGKVLFKQLVPLKLKQVIHSYITPHNINGNLASPKKKIFILLAADYGNLGDVAISYAQYQFLLQRFPDYEIIDVPISQTLVNLRVIKKYITEHDILTSVGGGNLTNQYQEIEDFRIKCLTSFPNNRFISFPQTIDFSDDQAGERSKQRSFDAYNEHANFQLFAREYVSLQIMDNLFDKPVLFCPDIVLSLDQSQPEQKRTGIVCCIRNDGESNLSPANRSVLMSEIEAKYLSSVTFTDTHIPASNMSWQQREQELMTIWQTFRGAKVIVTDRLHGMIFSVITKTPCVVLTNTNHKILQTYKNWLSELPHVCLVENYHLEKILSGIEKLMLVDNQSIELPDLQKKYNVLEKAISGEL